MTRTIPLLDEIPQLETAELDVWARARGVYQAFWLCAHYADTGQLRDIGAYHRDVEAWGNLPLSEGVGYFPPTPGDDCIRPAGTEFDYGVSTEDAAAHRKCYAAYRRGVVEGVRAVTAAFTNETIRFLRYTVRTVLDEEPDIETRLSRRQMTASAGNDALDALLSRDVTLEGSLAQCGAYWTTETAREVVIPDILRDESECAARMREIIERDEADKKEYERLERVRAQRPASGQRGGTAQAGTCIAPEPSSRPQEAPAIGGAPSCPETANAPAQGQAGHEDDSEFKKLKGCVVDAADYISEDLPPVEAILEGVFDVGDKVVVLAGPKMKKTYFKLLLALSLATGRPFLGIPVRAARRVLYANLEIKGGNMGRRVKMMARALGISDDELRGHLHIANLRGAGLDQRGILSLVRGMAADGFYDVVIFDPLYKLVTGDENSAKDMKPILAEFDKLATETGAAIMYSHHDAKGSPGDREIRDRGAGSNVLGRDYDTGITLTAHRTDPEAVVINFLCRNYPSPKPVVARFKDGAFRLASDLTPEVVTSRAVKTGGGAGQVSIEMLKDQAMLLFRSGQGEALKIATVRAKLERMAGTRQRGRDLYGLLLAEELIAELRIRGKGRNEGWVGNPEQIEAKRQLEFPGELSED